MANEYDLVVIGAGTGGYVAAIRAAQLGLTVAVVERAPTLGGTCLNWGCIPTKALLEHAHALKIAQNAKLWGLTFGKATVGIDIEQVQSRKNRVVKGLTKGIEFLFKKNKVEWIKGSARLMGNGRVEVVGTETLQIMAKEIIVATGSAPRSVPGIDIDHKQIITSDEAIALHEIPKSLVIMGSGAVGVEFASIFNRFGSEVTLVELLPRLVPVEDEAISAELEKSFKKQRIRCLTGTKVLTAIASTEGVEIEAELPGGQLEKIQSDLLLVATGRGPVTAGLGAKEVGLKLESGYILVDDQLRTNVTGISAVGDVITLGRPGHPQLAHLSSAEGILVAERMAGLEVEPLNYDQVPGCTYCDPEIGSVGLTEQEAGNRGYDVKVGNFPFGVLGRAKMAGEQEGFVKIVAETKHDELLGVHMIGMRSTELVAEATVALRLKSTVRELVRTIHAHPTMAEAVGEAAHAVHGSAIHM